MSRPEPIISVSGLRGIVGQTLHPEVVTRYVGAFAASLPPGPVVVTRDGRTTGPMIADAVRATLTAAGRSALDAGCAATPTTGVLVKSLQAAGGVQISASHNPPEYNGLKLFNADGRVFPSSDGEQVLAAYRRGDLSGVWKTHEAVAATAPVEDTINEHLRRILQICDVERIQQRRFRVVLDANHGAGAILGQPLLEQLGCEVFVLGGEPNGRFAHPAEPTVENLDSVLAETPRRQAAIGFCQDPDADRLAVIDEAGRYVGEEFTLAMCVEHVLRSRPGPVVTNCSTSRMTEDLAARHGVPFFRSRVGEANVVDLMLEHDAVIGGEGNGGVIDPRVGLVRDSFAGIGLLLDAMAARDAPVSQLADALPQYAICKTKATFRPEQVEGVLDALEARFPEADVDRMDGLRLDWPDKWLLVRASNTEPIIRAIAEAPTADEAQALCAALGAA